MEENKHIPLPKRLEAIEKNIKSIARFFLAKEKGNDVEIENAKTDLESIVK